MSRRGVLVFPSHCTLTPKVAPPPLLVVAKTTDPDSVPTHEIGASGGLRPGRAQTSAVTLGGSQGCRGWEQGHTRVREEAKRPGQRPGAHLWTGLDSLMVLEPLRH